MSIHLTDRVWREAPFEGGRLLALLALADGANDQGIFWHSVEYLAVKARLSDRQMSRHLSFFVKLGILERHPRAKQTNIWRLVLPPDWRVLFGLTTDDHNAVANAPDADDLPKDVTRDTHPAARVSRVTSIALKNTSMGDMGDIPMGDTGDIQGCHRCPVMGDMGDIQNRNRTVKEEPLERTVTASSSAHLHVVKELAPQMDQTRAERHALWADVKAALNLSKAQRANWLDPCALFEVFTGDFVLVAQTTEQLARIKRDYLEVLRIELEAMCAARHQPFNSFDVIPNTPAGKPSYSQHSQHFPKESMVTA